MFIGYKEIKLQAVTDTALLLTAAEVEDIIGRPYDNQRDAVMVMNAYGNITATGASPLHFWQAEWWSDGVRIYLSRDFGASTIRCAYVLFIGEQFSVSQTVADNVLCTRIGSVAVVSVDYIASDKAGSSTKIGMLPEGMVAVPGLGQDGGVHIAPLGYRGNADGRSGYVAVYSETGNIFIWTSTAGADQRYYFGQVVVPLASW